MSKTKIDLKEPIIWHKRLNVPYKHSVGPVGSKFLRALGEKKILAIKCSSCDRVYVPPQSICPACFTPLNNLIELNGEGTLVTYTVIRYPSSAQPVSPPFAVGIIKLDGADTGLVHLLGDVDFEKINIGMRLKPVFKEKPEGNILDIRHFKPI